MACSVFLSALSRAHGILSIQFGCKMIPPMKSCQMTPPNTITFLLCLSRSRWPLTLRSVAPDHRGRPLRPPRQGKARSMFPTATVLVHLSFKQRSLPFAGRVHLQSSSFRLYAPGNLDDLTLKLFTQVTKLPGSVVQTVGSGRGLIFTCACH